MKYRPLGRSDIKVSEISLGCWTMGGLNWVNGTPNGWANVNEDEVTAAIRRAVDAGVNHFDNADVYGNGKAERMLARVLKRLGLRSTDFVIATKVGHFPGTAEHAYDPLHLRHQCEQSLQNLGRDYVDLYYLHHGDFGPQGEWLQGAADTLDALVKEGKIRLKGQSAYSEKDFARAVPVVKPAVLQSWANALAPDFIRPGGVVPRLLAEHGMSFVAFSPLAQGLLLDKFDPEKPPQFEEGDHRRNSGRFTPEKLRALKPKLARLKSRFGATTEDLAGVAQRYILNHPNVACVIPGFRNDRQVVCNLAGADRELSVVDQDFITQVLS
ncbi:MAG TPA: aldo/keto reductase [Opitutaceae bacterium]|nr:aldo/keto reductase [Opitutaceae bacterium]HND60558.1 aldo/keto reductase [Opitutaceae bacterium]